MKITKKQLKQLIEHMTKPNIPYADDKLYSNIVSLIDDDSAEQADVFASSLGYEGDFSSDLNSYNDIELDSKTYGVFIYPKIAKFFKDEIKKNRKITIELNYSKQNDIDVFLSKSKYNNIAVLVKRDFFTEACLRVFNKYPREVFKADYGWKYSDDEKLLQQINPAYQGIREDLEKLAKEFENIKIVERHKTLDTLTNHGKRPRL